MFKIRVTDSAAATPILTALREQGINVSSVDDTVWQVEGQDGLVAVAEALDANDLDWARA